MGADREARISFLVTCWRWGGGQTQARQRGTGGCLEIGGMKPSKSAG